jgi:hypothetical protein
MGRRPLGARDLTSENAIRHCHVAADAFREVGGEGSLADGALDDGFVQVVTAAFAGLGVEVAACGGEEPLPGPLARSVGVFGAQGVGDFYVAGTAAEISLMLLANAREVKLELGDGGDRERSESVFAAFAVAHSDFAAL